MKDPAALFYVFLFPPIVLGMILAGYAQEKRKKDNSSQMRTLFGKKWPPAGWSKWGIGITALACLAALLVLLWISTKDFILGYILACVIIIVLSLRALFEEKISSEIIFLSLSIYWFSTQFLWARILFGVFIGFLIIFSIIRKKGSIGLRVCWIFLFIANLLSGHA